jgi:lysophospholipase L1-like esterase
VPFVALSKPGTRIDQWAESVTLDDTLRDFQPTLVLVSLGTNDAYQGAGGWAREHAAFEALLTKLKQFSNKYANGEDPAHGPYFSAGAEVIWIGPPRLPPKSLVGSPIDPAFLDELANAAPNYFHSEQLDIPKGPDGIHPTASGYAGWAGALWNWLSP